MRIFGFAELLPSAAGNTACRGQWAWENHCDFPHSHSHAVNPRKSTLEPWFPAARLCFAAELCSHPSMTAQSRLQFPDFSITHERGRHILKSCLNFLPAPSLDIYLINLFEHFVSLFCCFYLGKVELGFCSAACPARGRCSWGRLPRGAQPSSPLRDHAEGAGDSWDGDHSSELIFDHKNLVLPPEAAGKLEYPSLHALREARKARVFTCDC